MNFFVNMLWIFSYPNYCSKIGFMTQHYVFENFHAPFQIPSAPVPGINNDQSLTLYDAICSNLESLTIKLNIRYVRPILITTIYRSPGSTVDLFPKLEELLKSLEPDDTEIIFMGDLN